MFGFNNPSPNEDQEYYGYEFWVTIPENMNVPEPLTKKNFDGGFMLRTALRWGIFMSGSSSLNGQKIIQNMILITGSLTGWVDVLKNI